MIVVFTLIATATVTLLVIRVVETVQAARELRRARAAAREAAHAEAIAFLLRQETRLQRMRDAYNGRREWILAAHRVVSECECMTYEEAVRHDRAIRG